ncbi:AraC family transcriptional regulator [Pantoea sp.]|uniref:AraC family transcriptional regulator n=1 Tax=Pantoea sp. TaxID=69393 RepID=UPI0028B1CFF2|nr:AraC family transcriptional regulator [Pantoea sp.]
MKGIEALREEVLACAADALTATAIPRVDLYRVSQPMALPPEIYSPFVSLILQGEKRLQVGDRAIRYSAGEMFTASFDLPATGDITHASEVSPYLAVRLTLDFAAISDLLHQMPVTDFSATKSGLSVNRVDDALADAWLRMVRLLAKPEEIGVMAPLVEREILYRLLQGPQGGVLRQAAEVNGHFAKIRKALVWLRTHYTAAIRIQALATIAGMSLSAFHRGFRACTGLSPLQYQKHLRLYAARKRLALRPGNVAAVAADVGYESLTQFTRDYARLFGEPPARSIRKLRQNDAEHRAELLQLSEDRGGPTL